MTGNQIFTIFYGLLMLVILFVPTVAQYPLYYFTKPLIMISLMGWVVLIPDERIVRGKKLLLTGMFFALVGDCLLMLKGYFLEGLAAFLIMQWCYVIAFRKDYTQKIPIKNALLFALPIAVSTGILLNMLLQEISAYSMSIAIIIYTISIGTMLWFSLMRKFSVDFRSFIMVAAGALLFTVSDSLIAWNKFVSPVENGHFWIMSTYMMAQYLITRGMLKLPA